jgi:uncharacterized protein YbjT (DUF2867 family)
MNSNAVPDSATPHFNAAASTLRAVVIGGTGLIGSKLVALLGGHGHKAIAASPNTGVNTLTGEGLADVLAGASVVVDVSNTPSFEDAAALAFFETSTRNLLDAEARAGVAHHVVLSVVGAERLTNSGYMCAKMAQERLVRESLIPFSIVHATQFFEFIGAIGDAATDAGVVRLAPVLVQPMAADDVARALGQVAAGTPLNSMVEVAGPDRYRLDELVRRFLLARKDQRRVIADARARYFGAELGDRTLLPGDRARLAPTHLHQWLRLQPTQQ